ncbi:hypothetical protein GCM10009554_40700 [Kribbella koreensis]|uniref:Uncharacterized protein n=1 Tax=Kribbella koreensis TaxID=57909 RepID=A0ABN1QPH5_9ACTN
MDFLGVLVLISIYLGIWLAGILRDTGSREHLAFIGRTHSFVFHLIRLEDAGYRVRDLTPPLHSMRRKLSQAVIGPLIYVLLGWGLHQVFHPPLWVTCLGVALLVALFGAFDVALFDWLGLTMGENIRSHSKWFALAVATGSKVGLTASGIWVAATGAAAVNGGAAVKGVALILASALLLSVAHRPAAWTERASRRRRGSPSGTRSAADGLLFLRSFTDDRITIRSLLGNIGLARPVFPGMRARFEENIAVMLVNNGNLMALGRPGEQLPDLGAARTYYPHENWQAEVSLAANRARSIYIVAGSTEGLKWEIEQLHSWSLLTKTIILFPPDADQARSRARFVSACAALNSPVVEEDLWVSSLWIGMGYDEDGEIVHYLSTGRDWAAYFGAIIFFNGIHAGRIARPVHETQRGEQLEAAGTSEPSPVDLQPGEMKKVMTLVAYARHRLAVGDEQGAAAAIERVLAIDSSNAEIARLLDKQRE